MTGSTAEKIDNYQFLLRKKNRTDAIMDLLEAALYVMENAQRLDDPAVLRYFQDNLYNVQLVDDITDGHRIVLRQ